MTKYQKSGMYILLVVLVGVGTYYILYHREAGNNISNLSSRSTDANYGEFLNAQKAVGYYRDQIRKNPEVTKNYVELAQLFLQEARVTGRHQEYIPKAQFLLLEVFKREPENFEATITKASMLMTLHQFEEAKKLAENAISRNPYNASAYAVLCDALVELGQYDEAVKTCDKMLSIRPDLRSYARASYLRELHGDLTGAIEAMKLAADAGVFGRENRAWTLYNLANLFLHQGKLDTAEYIFKGILEERPNYAYALTGLAKVQAARKKYVEAIFLYEQAIDLLPEHAFAEALADVYLVAGKPAEAEKYFSLVREMLQDDEKNGMNIDLELASFNVDHDQDIDEALRRARREYERRPKSIKAADALGWALGKAGRFEEAYPYIQQSLRLGTKDASMLYHAGFIAQQLGKKNEAREYLTKALAVNPYFSHRYAMEAQNFLGKLNRSSFVELNKTESP